jgi:hypothetical protein
MACRLWVLAALHSLRRQSRFAQEDVGPFPPPWDTVHKRHRMHTPCGMLIEGLAVRSSLGDYLVLFISDFCVNQWTYL